MNLLRTQPQMNSPKSSYESRTTSLIGIHHIVCSHTRPLITKPLITSLYTTNLSSGISQPYNSRDRSSCQDLASTPLAPDNHQPLFPTLAAIPTSQALQIIGIVRTLETVYTQPIKSSLNLISKAQTLLPSRARARIPTRARTKARAKIPTRPSGHHSPLLALRVHQCHMARIIAIRSSITLEPLQAISDRLASKHTLLLLKSQPNS